MIVEHTFVTTLEPAETFSLADTVLAPYGFERTLIVTPDPHPRSSQTLTATSAEWVAGAETLREAKGYTDLPQRLRIDFDRGRVTVAAAVEDPRNKPKLFEAFYIALMLALESRLAAEVPPDDPIPELDAAQARLAKAHRRYRRTQRGLLVFLVILVLLIIAIPVALVALEY